MIRHSAQYVLLFIVALFVLGCGSVREEQKSGIRAAKTPVRQAQIERKLEGKITSVSIDDHRDFARHLDLRLIIWQEAARFGLEAPFTSQTGRGLLRAVREASDNRGPELHLAVKLVRGSVYIRDNWLMCRVKLVAEIKDAKTNALRLREEGTAEEWLTDQMLLDEHDVDSLLDHAISRAVIDAMRRHQQAQSGATTRPHVEWSER